MWIIKSITDKGADNHYRWRVHGENTSREIPTEFYWSVPDLSDERFCVHPDAPQSVRELFSLARSISPVVNDE